VHVLFLTDNFPPEVNAPATRTYEHARLWVEAGHQVTVVTCAPNFPTGRVFEGYRNRLVSREVCDGIRVVRVWSYITANKGFFRRSLDFASFMAAATVAGLFVRKPDVVVATSPQFFTAIAGWAVGALRRRPFVFELRDLWPESIRAVGAMEKGRAFRTLSFLEMFLYRRAAAVVSVTNAFRDNLINRGIDERRVHVVTNGVDLVRFKAGPADAALAESLGVSGKFVAGYVGTHGMAHSLETLLDAAALLRGRDDIRLLLIGDGAEKNRLRQMASDKGLSNLLFVDTVQRSEIRRYLSILDAAVVHLKDTPLFETVIPSKIFEAMAMGIPLVHGVRGESAAIVAEAGAGIVVPPEDAQAIAAALVRIADDPALAARLGGAGREAALGYDRSVLAGQMLEVLVDVSGARGSARR